jgi:hypothetical protein
LTLVLEKLAATEAAELSVMDFLTGQPKVLRECE